MSSALRICNGVLLYAAGEQSTFLERRSWVREPNDRPPMEIESSSRLRTWQGWITSLCRQTVLRLLWNCLGDTERTPGTSSRLPTFPQHQEIAENRSVVAVGPLARGAPHRRAERLRPGRPDRRHRAAHSLRGGGQHASRSGTRVGDARVDASRSAPGAVDLRPPGRVVSKLGRASAIFKLRAGDAGVASERSEAPAASPGPARGHYGRATPFFQGDAMTVGMPCRRPQGDDRNVAGRVIGEP